MTRNEIIEDAAKLASSLAHRYREHAWEVAALAYSGLAVLAVEHMQAFPPSVTFGHFRDKVNHYLAEAERTT